ncbi:MucR family transcriptional regulator [Virgifigura deserti]|uniref:MucR family transcriptional regulator n=1 Tax=Virgifigura deserti TaxID=2268457 RepID=UPI003CCB7AAD
MTEQDHEKIGSEDIRIAEMTTRIVTSYLAHNAVSAGELPQVISSVASGLRAAEGRAEAATSPVTPAVPIQKSVSRNHVICLLCGEKHKMLKRHLTTTHHVTPREYREMFNLRSDYPLVAPEYAKRRSQLAHEYGLGRKGNAPSSRSEASAGRTKAGGSAGRKTPTNVTKAA